MITRTEFPNLAIVSIVLKDFIKAWKSQLEEYYTTPEEKLCAVRNAASDEGNDEIVAMLDYIEVKGLTETFFPRSA